VTIAGLRTLANVELTGMVLSVNGNPQGISIFPAPKISISMKGLFVGAFSATETAQPKAPRVGPPLPKSSGGWHDDLRRERSGSAPAEIYCFIRLTRL
jgi:hypothetical protein